MSYENSRYKNIGNDEGDVLNFFGNLRNLIQKNGGDNTFSSYTEDFHEKTIPFYTGEKTKLMLTHPNHTISQIEKGFIEMTVEFQVGFEKPILKNDFLIKKIDPEVLPNDEKVIEACNAVNKNYENIKNRMMDESPLLCLFLLFRWKRLDFKDLILFGQVGHQLAMYRQEIEVHPLFCHLKMIFHQTEVKLMDVEFVSKYLMPKILL